MARIFVIMVFCLSVAAPSPAIAADSDSKHSITTHELLRGTGDAYRQGRKNQPPGGASVDAAIFFLGKLPEYIRGNRSVQWTLLMIGAGVILLVAGHKYYIATHYEQVEVDEQVWVESSAIPRLSGTKGATESNTQAAGHWEKTGRKIMVLRKKETPRPEAPRPSVSPKPEPQPFAAETCARDDEPATICEEAAEPAFDIEPAEEPATPCEEWRENICVGESRGKSRKESVAVKEHRRWTDVEFPARTKLRQWCELSVAIALKELILEDGRVITLEKAHAHDQELIIQQRVHETMVVDVVVSAPSYRIDGEPRARIEVPENTDSERARFRLMPTESGLRPVFVNFFQNKRYIGTVRLDAEVFEHGDSGPVRHAPIFGGVDMSGAGLAPDLTVLIAERRHDNESPELHFTLISRFPEFDGQDGGAVPLRADPARWMEETLAGIERLIQTPGSADLTQRSLEAVGRSLFDQVFPARMKDLYWRFRDKAASVVVISDEPWIPWEMIKPHRVVGPQIQDEPHLCEKFLFSRWLAGSPYPAEITSRNGVVVGMGAASSKIVRDIGLRPSPSSNDTLENVDEELAMIGKLATGRMTISKIEPRLKPILQAMERGGFGLMHFACHGSFNCESPGHSMLQLAGGDALTPEFLCDPRLGFGRLRPFVFLNACHSGRIGHGLTGVGNWAAQFLNAGCGAFVGALWAVEDDLAYEFARQFYSDLFNGQSFGESFRRARLWIKREDSPTWLAFSLYADPNARLVAKDAPSPVSDVPAIFPESIDLGEKYVGTYQEQSIFFSRQQEGVLEYAVESDQPWMITEWGLAIASPESNSLNFTLDLRSVQPGSLSGTITVRHCGGFSRINVRVRAIPRLSAPPPAPVVSVSTETLDFADVFPRKSKTLSFTITNRGELPTRVEMNPPLTTNCALSCRGLMLQPNQSATVEVTVNTETAGAATNGRQLVSEEISITPVEPAGNPRILKAQYCIWDQPNLLWQYLGILSLVGSIVLFIHVLGWFLDDPLPQLASIFIPPMLMAGCLLLWPGQAPATRRLAIGAAVALGVFVAGLTVEFLVALGCDYFFGEYFFRSGYALLVRFAFGFALGGAMGFYFGKIVLRHERSAIYIGAAVALTMALAAEQASGVIVSDEWGRYVLLISSAILIPLAMTAIRCKHRFIWNQSLVRRLVKLGLPLMLFFILLEFIRIIS